MDKKQAIAHSSIFLICCLLLLGFAGCASKKTAFTPVDIIQADKVGQHDAMIASMINRYQLPAIQIAYTQSGKLTELHGGHDSFERIIPISADHLLHAGSGTKLFTATVAMILLEQNKITLEDTLSQWYPKFPNSDRITIRMLLNHTSGIENNFSDIWMLALSAMDANRKWSPDEIFDRLYHKPLQFEPGERFAYASTNYLLLGAIFEKITGLSLNLVYKHYLFDPLGMAHTYLPPFDDVTHIPRAGGLDIDYVPFGKRYMSPDETAWKTLSWAAGGCVSTAKDMARFIDALFSYNIVKKQSLEQMLQFDADMSEDPRQFVTGYGLGVARYQFGKEQWYGHRGALMGWESITLYNQKYETGVAIIISKTKKKSDMFLIFSEVVDQL